MDVVHIRYDDGKWEAGLGAPPDGAAAVTYNVPPYLSAGDAVGALGEFAKPLNRHEFEYGRGISGLPRNLDETEVITSMMRLMSSLPVEFYTGSFKGRPYVHTEPLPGKESPEATFLTSHGFLDTAMREVEGKIEEAFGSGDHVEEVISGFLVTPPDFSRMSSIRA